MKNKRPVTVLYYRDNRENNPIDDWTDRDVIETLREFKDLEEEGYYKKGPYLYLIVYIQNEYEGWHILLWDEPIPYLDLYEVPQA